MNKSRIFIILVFFIIIFGCIKDYEPKIDLFDEVLIIEGLITDRPGPYYVKLRMANALWRKVLPSTVKGYVIFVSDDLGNKYPFTETSEYGVYASDSTSFRAEAGRIYTLQVQTNPKLGSFTYVSLPVKMIKVPEIDSVYFLKKNLPGPPSGEGCDIFLDTDAGNEECRFFRFEYDETWEYSFPFRDHQKTCWTTMHSENITIKSTMGFTVNRIKDFPVTSINNPFDRLSIKYSILVSQFSLNEEEFVYWERLKNSIDLTGGLYDIVPATIPNNLICVEDSMKKVLGYFSVSSVSSKRLFIKEKFNGSNLNYTYNKCLTDTIYTNFPDTIPGYGTALWILEDHTDKKPPWVVCTRNTGCYFCEVRGTSLKPDFWDDDVEE